MIWARWAGVMGVPMKWEIARIFVVGTDGSGFCVEAAPSGVIGFFMAVAPYSSFDASTEGCDDGRVERTPSPCQTPKTINSKIPAQNEIAQDGLILVQLVGTRM